MASSMQNCQEVESKAGIPRVRTRVQVQRLCSANHLEVSVLHHAPVQHSTTQMERIGEFREQQFHQSLTHHCEVSHYTSAEPAELRPKSLPNTHYEYNHSAQSVEQSWIPMERQLPNFPPLLMSNNEPPASFCICGDTNCHQQYKPAYYHPVPNGYIPAYEGIQRPSEQGYSRAFTGNYRA
jgi:hypothetical protein